MARACGPQAERLATRLHPALMAAMATSMGVGWAGWCPWMRDGDVGRGHTASREPVWGRFSRSCAQRDSCSVAHRFPATWQNTCIRFAEGASSCVSILCHSLSALKLVALRPNPQVVIEGAELAVQAILENCCSLAFLSAVAGVVTSDKNPRLRRAATAHLLAAARQMEGGSVPEGAAGILQPAALAAVADAGEDTRRLGRDLFAWCAAAWPAWATRTISSAQDPIAARRLRACLHFTAEGSCVEPDHAAHAPISTYKPPRDLRATAYASSSEPEPPVVRERERVRAPLAGLVSGPQRVAPRHQPDLATLAGSISGACSRENVDVNVLRASPQKVPSGFAAGSRETQGAEHQVPGAAAEEHRAPAPGTAFKSRGRRSIGGNALRVALARVGGAVIDGNLIILLFFFEDEGV